ncbi:type III effector [Pseudomonas caricapapayae]|uniref:type III effector n=1 Tax=Pseudomonas caricapapayae TaxID=46678 RepID=UPI000ABB7FD2|nr:type III effector [Pseudomonas caricapapayae]
MKETDAGIQAYALFAPATGSSSMGVLRTIARHLTGCCAPGKATLCSAIAVSHATSQSDGSIAASTYSLPIDHRQPALTRLNNALFNQALALDLERFDEGAPADEMFSRPLTFNCAHPLLACSMDDEQLAVRTMEKGLKRLAESPAQCFARCNAVSLPARLNSDTTSLQA